MKNPKFKVWDKETKKFLDKDFFLTQDGRVGYCFAVSDGYKDPAYSVEFEEEKEVEVVFFTGLKDKNGVEIYEGDIVKKKASDEARQVVWNIQRACYYLHPLGEISQNEVDVDEFNTATAMASHWFTQGFYESYEEDCAVEVIGNVYENVTKPTKETEG